MQGCVLDAWLPHTAARIASIHPRLTGRIVAATRCVVLPPNPALGERDPLLCSTLNREKKKSPFRQWEASFVGSKSAGDSGAVRRVWAQVTACPRCASTSIPQPRRPHPPKLSSF
jgi:hypothetical protein